MSDDQMSWNLGEEESGSEQDKSSQRKRAVDFDAQASVAQPKKIISKKVSLKSRGAPPAAEVSLDLTLDSTQTDTDDAHVRRDSPTHSQSKNESSAQSTSRWKSLFSAMVEQAQSTPSTSTFPAAPGSTEMSNPFDISESPSPVTATRTAPSQTAAKLAPDTAPTPETGRETPPTPELVQELVTTQPFESAKKEEKVLSVSDLNKAIREIIEGQFPSIWLKGEISNFKPHTSGHYYFSLKDERSQISAVMFKGLNSKLKFKPENGMEVLVRGKITVFEPRGSYQIFCESMEPVGAGALQLAYEQLKAKLHKEGLFDAAKKRALPFLPKTIAIVTSPTGAAIRDMLNVLGRRHRSAHIFIVPCKVQGDQAPQEIIQALRLVNLMKDVDVCIVGRGGGSIEDLWAFNDEGVARAIAQCKVPIISAVGHEIDFTIADFVADLRAPTPSAAAELVAKSSTELAERVARLDRSLKVSLHQHFKVWRQHVLQISKRLVDPRRKLQDLFLRNDELVMRLERVQKAMIQRWKMQVEKHTPQPSILKRLIELNQVKLLNLQRKLERNISVHTNQMKQRFIHQVSLLQSLNPLQVLTRGFALVKDENGHVLTHAPDTEKIKNIEIQFQDGSVHAEIIKK